MELKEELSQFCDIKKEIRELETKIEKIKRTDKTVDVVEGSSDKFPFVKKHFKIEHIDKVKNDTLKMYYSILQNRYDRLLEVQTRLEVFIDEIPTSRLRRIFEYRYIEQFSWVKIARLIGGNATSDSIRMEHDRFLQKN